LLIRVYIFAKTTGRPTPFVTLQFTFEEAPTGKNGASFFGPGVALFTILAVKFNIN
jgi:hypothetical protein